MNKQDAKTRLEYIRGEIRAERISYEEIAELYALAEYIDKDDVELLEWAGVDEFNQSGSALTDLCMVTLGAVSILALVFTLGALPALILFAQLATALKF